VSSDATRVSIIVVAYNAAKYIDACVTSLERAGGYHEIIVVDQASSDGTPDLVERHVPAVQLIRAGANLGFAAGNNLGARAASGDVLALFNPDAFATAGWLQPLVAALAGSVGIASPKVYRGLPGEATIIDSAGCDLEFPIGEGPPRGYLEPDDGRFDEPALVAYASGAAMVIRRDLYEMLGGLDESFFCYCEESDLCWRARMRGIASAYVPASTVYHVGSANLGSRSAQKLYFQTRNRIRMCLQNYAWLNALIFAGNEIVHGACVIAISLFFANYRPLGLAYLRAWMDVVRSSGLTWRTRTRRQRERTVGDGDVLRLHRRVGIFATLARYRRMTRQRAASLFNSTVPLSP